MIASTLSSLEPRSTMAAAILRPIIVGSSRSWSSNGECSGAGRRSRHRLVTSRVSRRDRSCVPLDPRRVGSVLASALQATSGAVQNDGVPSTKPKQDDPSLSGGRQVYANWIPGDASTIKRDTSGDFSSPASRSPRFVDARCDQRAAISLAIDRVRNCRRGCSRRGATRHGVATSTCAGAFAVAESDDDGEVERSVAASVAAAVESVAVDLPDDAG